MRICRLRMRSWEHNHPLCATFEIFIMQCSHLPLGKRMGSWIAICHWVGRGGQGGPKKKENPWPKWQLPRRKPLDKPKWKKKENTCPRKLQRKKIAVIKQGKTHLTSKKKNRGGQLPQGWLYNVAHKTFIAPRHFC